MGPLSVSRKSAAITASVEGGMVDVGHGLSVPQGIHATYAGGDDYPADLEVDLVLDGRRYVVDVLTIRRQEGGVSVTGEHLRKIPVQEIVLSLVSDLLSTILGGTESAKITRKEIKAAVEAGPTDQTLDLVARIYVFAELAGEPPAKSVRETLDIPTSTAGYWIRRAKDRGLLDG